MRPAWGDTKCVLCGEFEAKRHHSKHAESKVDIIEV
jgi:hypothetical protein